MVLKSATVFGHLPTPRSFRQDVTGPRVPPNCVWCPTQPRAKYAKQKGFRQGYYSTSFLRLLPHKSSRAAEGEAQELVTATSAILCKAQQIHGHWSSLCSTLSRCPPNTGPSVCCPVGLRAWVSPVGRAVPVQIPTRPLSTSVISSMFYLFGLPLLID